MGGGGVTIGQTPCGSGSITGVCTQCTLYRPCDGVTIGVKRGVTMRVYRLLFRGVLFVLYVTRMRGGVTIGAGL